VLTQALVPLGSVATLQLFAAVAKYKHIAVSFISL
jgi:hypothetical protein